MFRSPLVNKFDSSVFSNARIKLTIYYVAIVAVILLVFSILSYRGFVFEFMRGLRVRHPGDVVLDIPPPIGLFIAPMEIDEPTIAEVFIEAKRRVILNLLFINLTVLTTAGFGGYFLAGKTLKPIEEMVEEQKRFVSDASHELRTPLTSLKTEIEVALRDKNIGIGELKRLVKSNLEEVDKIQKLSNYLLTLNKYQGGLTKKETTSINLKDLAEKSISKLSVLAKRKNINILTKLEEVKIYGNEVSLTEVSTILLDNAIKYSDKGGKILIRTGKDRGCAILSVQDYGIGIKAGDLPYIFNRFYRADISRSKVKADGYGLGLSIAKAIVEANGGEIEVVSKPSKGSTFTARFPVVS